MSWTVYGIIHLINFFILLNYENLLSMQKMNNDFSLSILTDFFLFSTKLFNFQVFIEHLCFNLSFCWEFMLIRSLHLLKVLTFIFFTFWWKKNFFNLLILSAWFDMRKYRLHIIRYNTTLFLLFSLFLPYGHLLL